MTEDDTFEGLKRLPFESMSETYRKWYNNQCRDWNIHHLFKIHGWTFEEYFGERARRNKDDRGRYFP